MKSFRKAGFVVASFLLGFTVTSLDSGCGRSSGTETYSAGKPDQDLFSESPGSPVSPERKPPEITPETDNPGIDASEQGGGEPKKPADTEAKRTTAVGDASANAKLTPGDWPQLGGSSYRNNTPEAANIVTEWAVGSFERRTNDWIPDKAQNIKWVVRIGSQTYGTPIVSGGRLWVGTNNGAGYLKRYPPQVDLGCLICFNEADGAFLWQASSEKLPTGSVHDWPLVGICGSPLVEGNRLWYVTSRGEVVCLDTEGFYDGEDDGPVTNEQGQLFNVSKGEDPATDTVAPAVVALNEGKVTPELRQRFADAGMVLPGSPDVRTVEADKEWSITAEVDGASRACRTILQDDSLSAFKTITSDDKQEADTVWKFDMMGQLRISQHNMCSCSVTSLGDLLFVNTSNGVDESEEQVPSPDAPSFIAMDKKTGEVVWTDKSQGANILHGQWSSPAAGVMGGVPQVIFAGGDGWVYSFRADRGKDGEPELLWKFDTNRKESKWVVGGTGDRNNIIATPVIYDGLVYVAGGHDPEFGDGDASLWCIDPTKRGDVSPQLAVKADDHSKILPQRRIQAVITEQGETAIDNSNSAAVWEYRGFDKNGDGAYDFEETMHCSCASVAIKNDLLFIADFSGLVHCLHAKTAQLHWTYDTMANVWGSPLIVEDHIFIGDEDGDMCVFDLTPKPHEPIAEQNMEDSLYSSPTVANGVLYISSRSHLFAIQTPKE